MDIKVKVGMKPKSVPFHFLRPTDDSNNELEKHDFEEMLLRIRVQRSKRDLR